MTFDIESLNLDDSPIEGMEEAFENWQPDPDMPPTRPIKHMAAVREIQEAQVRNGVLELTLGFDLKGGEEDGEQLNFQRLDSRIWERRSDGVKTSPLLNLMGSAGMQGNPRTNKDLVEMVKHMIASGQTCNFKTGLSTYCSECARIKRAEITEIEDDDEAKEAMAAIEDKDERKAAYDAVRDAAVKHKNARSIPTNPRTKRHLSTVTCKDCGSEISVRPRIVAWLEPSNGMPEGEI